MNYIPRRLAHAVNHFSRPLMLVLWALIFLMKTSLTFAKENLHKTGEPSPSELAKFGVILTNGKTLNNDQWLYCRENFSKYPSGARNAR